LLKGKASEQAHASSARCCDQASCPGDKGAPPAVRLETVVYERGGAHSETDDPLVLACTQRQARAHWPARPSMRLAAHLPKPLLAHSHCARVKTPNSFQFGAVVSGGLGDCNRCIAYHGTNRGRSADVPNDLLTLCSCRISRSTLLVGSRAGISKAGLIAARSFRIRGRPRLEDVVICLLHPQLFVRAAEEGANVSPPATTATNQPTCHHGVDLLIRQLFRFNAASESLTAQAMLACVERGRIVRHHPNRPRWGKELS